MENSNHLPRERKQGLLDHQLNALFCWFGVTTKTEQRILILAIAIVLGYLESFVLRLQVAHTWILDARGHPLPMDFVAFWTAGKEAIHGAARAAYDPRLQHAAEVATIGHPYSHTVLGWTYPPIFLFIVAGLAALPYATAFFLWTFATWVFQAVVIAKIVGRRAAFVFALAAPWGYINISGGQNGFLTAGLIGLVMLNLETRPIVAGALLGALSYKPQFGVLFPVALVSGRFWRVLGWTVCSVLVFNGLAAAIFGFDVLPGFVRSLSLAGQTHLNGEIPWRYFQSLYGFARSLGSPFAPAVAAQFLLSLSLAVAVSWSWRTNLSFALKAAILVASIPLASPYIYAHDLPILSIALAFLYREREFDGTEWLLLAAAVPLAFLYIFVPLPTGFATSLIVGVIGVRRMGRSWAVAAR